MHTIVEKAFVLGVFMMFIALLLRKPTEALQFFSTQRIVLTQASRLPEINTVPLSFSVVDFDVRLSTVFVVRNYLVGGDSCYLSP